jgi:hypothetical protein
VSASGGLSPPLVIAADAIGAGSGEERVVAVRYIASPELETSDNVAVVTLDQDRVYSLYYFGLSRDGALVDLESMDVVRVRA